MCDLREREREMGRGEWELGRWGVGEYIAIQWERGSVGWGWRGGGGGGYMQYNMGEGRENGVYQDRVLVSLHVTPVSL